ncbi:hypothetical protein BZA05DRAFT_436014 [Tricharina praecox]|uniref:uncharacterized protein n=1 Tax=Tricharina praecox TaxID=43433 RepID=UPI00221E7187|nr:uncharacterized protein BZA05DRAFT_439825 [Tricharina praecox]XP_051339608.1 uncharacterized protein BZA05DRAFT_436014 [Tricharina praecox]KAI5841251.1 hypothetical protein BZA05DRAFT_439825 [Tricharina praecox]KAI5852118.1 hypothetical protein BZA05DRAFT_436014 [Tricharina praecox]
MNSSLPLITPRDSHTLWYTPSSNHIYYPPPPAYTQYSGGTSGSPHNNASQSGGSGQNQRGAPRSTRLSVLEQLEADEQNVAMRKLGIQRFGATWIKPPGMLKTLQGELDEKAEREEAEAQELLEQDVEIPSAFDEDPDVMHEITDLDANVPEGSISDLEGAVPGDSEDDSFMGVVVGGEQDGEEEEEEGDGGEVDLDDDVPEAEGGSYSDEDEDEEEEEEEDDEEEDGDEDEEEEEEGAHVSTAHEAPSGSSRPGSEEVGAPDESPLQAAFSHDECYPDERRQRARQDYNWRGNSRYRRETTDSMEVDSE